MESIPANNQQNLSENWRETKDPIPFERFVSPPEPERMGPTYNNFMLFFTDNEGFATKRESSRAFQRFAKENPDVESKLTHRISEILKSRDPQNPRDKQLKEIEADLYEAYKIMLSYDETENNWSLAA